MKNTFNHSEIFTTAWSFVKSEGIKLSTALKQAWFLAKDAIITAAEAVAEAAKVVTTFVYEAIAAAGITFSDTINHVVSLAERSGFDAKVWQAGNISRVYLSGNDRDVTAYIAMNEANMLEFNANTCHGLGCELVVIAKNNKFTHAQIACIRENIAKVLFKTQA